MIYDLDGNPLTTASLDLQSSQTKQLAVKIDCFGNNFLRCTTIAEIEVFAKHNDAADFQNIETDPLDLTDWQGSREIFQIKLVCGEITAVSQAFCDLSVKP